MHGPAFQSDWRSCLLLAFIGATASGINAVAGGGSLVSFPILTGVYLGDFRVGYGIPMKIANATNSAGLWPGSLSGAFGFWNVLPKTAHYLKTLWLPTVIGSVAGAWLLIVTSNALFEKVVPALLLLATLLLAFQPRIKAWAEHREARVSGFAAILLMFAVAVYGGYFGAGMGIMMLAVFMNYMEGDIHEINAVKTWLAVIINFAGTAVFLMKGIILIVPGLAMAAGAIVGGYFAAKYSQRVHPNTLRIIIACYGLLSAGYFAYKSWM